MTAPRPRLFDHLAFTGEWRDYQARVLTELDQHLADDRINLIAAPGSGKTIIGLEIIQKLGRPALVLAPNRTIRDQWASRLVPLFCDARPPGISSTLDAPDDLTIATYQALHAAAKRSESNAQNCGGSRDLDTLAAKLTARGQITLVLDEAHHLRREWWSALQELIGRLPGVQIVALTATPPYDASFAEWSRYSALCGPVDLEVSVPELVRNGDLCPHQDHIIFAQPSADTLALLHARNTHIAKLQQALLGDEILLGGLLGHPWLQQPEAHEEAILDAPELLSAMLILLAAARQPIPKGPLHLLGVKQRQIPALSRFWLEILLNEIMFPAAQAFSFEKPWIKTMRSRLASANLIEGKKVRLEASASHFKLMAGDLGKLASITRIASAEGENLGATLRMTVLTDFVREADLARAGTADYRPAKLGVVPIFGTLARRLHGTAMIGVLTGGLVIVPAASWKRLEQLAKSAGLPPGSLIMTPLRGFEGYCRITGSGERANAQLVRLITALFEEGGIHILVGTQSLLGEGWDAPAINSLILASNTAAFMLSNQMRGRAIRIAPDDTDKVANIWHLATVSDAPTGLAQELEDRLSWGLLGERDEPVTSDMDMLRRRFKAFEGIAKTASTRIESGLDRLAIDQHMSAEAANQGTFIQAQDRAGIAAKWAQSLGDAPPRSHVREVATPNYAPRMLAWRDTLQWLGTSGAFAGLSAAGWQLQALPSWGTFGIGLAAIGGAAAFATAPRLAKASILMARNGSLEKSLAQVAVTIIQGLERAGAVGVADLQAAEIAVEHSARGQAEIVVRGVSRSAEREILVALSEVLGPVRNPRYVLMRRSWLGLLRRTDYHAVPAAIARRKEWAEYFTELWNRQIGTSTLVFCRTAEGRRLLLKARASALAAGFQRRVDRFSAWL